SGRLDVIPNRLESAPPWTMGLTMLGNREIQTLIRGNFVCFPAQAPIFGERSRRNLQWRLAVLYFVRGWSTRVIAERYGLRRERCGQIISDWRIRAVALGYIQDVTPEGTDLVRLADSNALTTPAGRRHTHASSGDESRRDSVESNHAANGGAASDRISQTSFAISAAGRLPSILR